MDLYTLLEDRTQGYIHLLKGSKVPLPKAFMLQGERIDGDYLEPETKTIGDLPDHLLVGIIEEVDSVVDPEFKKYEEYFIQQIAKGNMPLDKIMEDGERFNITLRLFQKLSRKAIWKGSKDIFGYDNWRTLETVTRKLAKEANVPETGHGETDQDSILLFKKSYADSRAELFAAIYGDTSDVPTANKTYYLRKVLTPEGACKYGKGTQWCTNTRPPPKTITLDELRKVAMKQMGRQPDDAIAKQQLFDYSLVELMQLALPAYGMYNVLVNGQINPDASKSYKPELIKSIVDVLNGKTTEMINPQYYTNTAMSYIKRGLYIIELEDDKPRRPILQLSQDQIMNVRDMEITKAGPMLGDFIKSAMATVKDSGLKHFENLL